MFNYGTIDTVDLQGKRFYVVAPDTYYPSITTVLGNTTPEEKKASLKRWQDSLGISKANAVRDEAARRGTQVHAMVEQFLKGETVDTSGCQNEDLRLFNCLKLKLKQITKLVAQEVPLCSHLLQVAGRCDMVGEHEGELSILDLKTSTRPKTKEQIEDYWLQTCFYAIAHNETFGTNIEKLVIMMTVEGYLPLVFQKRIDTELVEKLMTRIDEFYRTM